MNTGEDGLAPLVVIVDDEVDIATYLRLALDRHGFRVAAFSDAESAEEALEISEPAAICLDLLMPKQSGLSLYKAIVESPRLCRCPVIIISGLAVRGDLPDLLQRAGELPMPQAFIDKPIDIDEFIATLESLLAANTGFER
jgi:twitching motility two-component system response regulator PilH